MLPLELNNTLNFSKMSTKISFLSDFPRFKGFKFFPVFLVYGLALLMGLLTADEGAVALLNMFHFEDITLSSFFLVS